METQDDIILELQHFSKSFGTNRVLSDVSLQLHKGTVMCLMGENGAGKSTMMRCLFGILEPDSGKLIFQGKQVKFNGPKDALERGVSMVHQELNQCLDLSVMDNIWLGRFPKHFGVVNRQAMYINTLALFKRLGMNIDPKAVLRGMPVAQRQMIEIAKAVSYDAKVIILDEPTSSLSDKEVNKLFEIIRALKKKGVSFIYISHKMDEVFQIADYASVLRDGHMILVKKVYKEDGTKNVTMDELVKGIVGRPLTQRFPKVENVPTGVLLQVKGLSTNYGRKLEDVTFEAHAGEVLGIYGLIGAGRTELLESLFGSRKISRGRIYYKGHSVLFKSPEEAMQHGFAMITEERKLTGIFPLASIEFNTCIANMKHYKRGVVLSNTMMENSTRKEVKNLNTKVESIKLPISSLSGGNQQKVIFGRWMERNPDICLFDEPTRGIDVGAKYEIYQLILRMAKEGRTILMVSSEMPEVIGISNRIMVMSNGRVAGILDGEKVRAMGDNEAQQTLLNLSAKYL